jgi:hypothetical protein
MAVRKRAGPTCLQNASGSRAGDAPALTRFGLFLKSKAPESQRRPSFSLVISLGTRYEPLLRHIKAPPSGWVMLIVYAIDTLRAGALLHAASTPSVEAVLAAGRRSRDSGCGEGLC